MKKKASAVCLAARVGFTLIELLTVITIVAVLAAILLPALSQARDRSQGIFCMNNTRQLSFAWSVYAGDHDSALPYNLVMSSGSPRSKLNWVNNVMTWDLSEDNTNVATITEASLGPYVGGQVSLYRCPSDRALSGVQRSAGWIQRLRSYSMNAMVGNAGPASAAGFNTNNPGYKQFFKIEQIPHPTDIFVFLDEHPDSIDDGYFLNQEAAARGGGGYGYGTGGNQWLNLPASYHNRSTAFSFADGHAGLHRWLRASTIRPPIPHATSFPLAIPAISADENADFDWVMSHMSVENQPYFGSGQD